MLLKNILLLSDNSNLYNKIIYVNQFMSCFIPNPSLKFNERGSCTKLKHNPKSLKAVHTFCRLYTSEPHPQVQMSNGL